MRSLKRILIFWTTTATVAILVVAGVVFYFLVRGSLIAQYDRLLLDKARLLASIPEQGSKKLHLEFDEFKSSALGSTQHSAYVQVWSASGVSLYRSPNLHGGDLQRCGGPIGTPVHGWIDLPGGLTGRAVGMTFVPRHEDVEEEPRAEPKNAAPAPGKASGRPAARGSAGARAAKDTGRGYQMAAGARLTISEFMAANKSVLADANGDFADWIEIHNFSGAGVELDGWYLTDRVNDVRWRFPHVRIAAGGYLLVFGANKHRTGSSAQLHTNFKLTTDGEYLALVRRDGKTVEFAYVPKYPRQAPNVSYGLAPDSLRLGYFRQPTPGARNTSPRSDTRPLPRNGPVTLVLARDTRAVDETLGRLAALLVCVGIAVVPAIGGVLWLVIGRSLRHLDRLAAQISRLREHDLGKRVAVPDAPRELQPVIDRLNHLLNQLDAALQRERGFSADVAHELRTPLAGLRLQIDLALSQLRQPEEYRTLIVNCREIAMQMHVMVGNLLLLARLETGRLTLQREPVMLSTLIRDAWKPLDESVRRRRIHVRWALDPDLRIVTDSSRIAVPIRNLLENAANYVNEGGNLTIESRAENGSALFRVRNSGSRVAAADVAHVFERFWRASAARTAAGTHCGLGLALTKRMVEVLGGSVAVSTRYGGDFTISITMPNGHGAGPEAGS